MRQSILFPKTLREAPKDEVAVSAKLLLRGGFIHKLAAGIYTYLPLGWRVVEKIHQIIREEMNAIGGQELFLPAMHPKSVWEETGRWKSAEDVMYQFKDSRGSEWALGFTHEEILTDIVRTAISSYKDLPLSLYQIQTKFRNEPRAKSGLIRAREFLMKDLYSFHVSEVDRAKYYEKTKQAYHNIFWRCGLESIVTEASGGLFSKRSHEFQVLTESGEDTIYYCPKKDYAINKEIRSPSSKCPAHSKEKLKAGKAIEVGNIFPLGTRFSEAMGAHFTDKDGKKKPMVMGSYGIGPGRVMGTIVEVHHDDRGIIWPETVAPFRIHLIQIKNQKSKIKNTGEKLYHELLAKGIEVLYDDRDLSAGEKFADADLIGCPIRVVVSEKTIVKRKVEIKLRGEKKAAFVSPRQLKAQISKSKATAQSLKL